VSFVSPGRVLAGPLEDLQPGEWYEVPNSHLRAVAASTGSDIAGATGVAAVMDAWSSGAYDTVRDRLYVTGGGHNDYFGNEVYAFDVNTLKWMRLTEPSPLATGEKCPPADRPCATHTYDGLEYLPPPSDRLLLQGFPNAGSSNVGYSTYLFDPGAKTWQRMTAYSYTGNEQRTGAVSAYDPVSGLFFYHTAFSGQLASYDAKRDQWKGYGYDGWLTYSFSAAIDPVRHQFVAIGDSSNGGQQELIGKIATFDISDPAATDIKVVPTVTTGDQSAVAANNAGFDYDVVSDKLVAWIGGGNVYALDAGTRSWKKHPPTNGVTPTDPNPNGTYGRFRYVPSKNLFILVNRVDDDVFFYKLGPGGGTPVDAGGLDDGSAGGGTSNGGSRAMGGAAGSGGNGSGGFAGRASTGGVSSSGGARALEDAGAHPPVIDGSIHVVDDGGPRAAAAESSGCGCKAARGGPQGHFFALALIAALSLRHRRRIVAHSSDGATGANT
jgi:MYXO-CTERM domain-containing protein